MRKPFVTALTIALVLPSFSGSTQTQPRKLTREEMNRACSAVYNQDEPSDSQTPFIGWRFEEVIWELAGATGKPPEEAYPLIRKMWLANRECFTCPGYPQALANGKNIAKFGMGLGSNRFLKAAMRRWKLDLDFKDRCGQNISDPSGADNKTILQFLEQEKARLYTERPINQDMIQRYDQTITEVKKYIANYQNPDKPE